MGGSLQIHTAEISAWDTVEFIGPPSSPVIGWPALLERGVVTQMQGDQSIVMVVWQKTTAVLAWPTEWVNRVHGPRRLSAN
jgi:hypothetical protein